MQDNRSSDNAKPDILIRLREASKIIGETHPVTAALMTDAAEEILTLRAFGYTPSDQIISVPADAQTSDAKR